jgi:LPXTG-motif cell wall-anchored protein
MRGNRVVLPPGQQHVYVVNPEGNQDVNTWYVDIIANRKAIFHSDRNQTTYEKWAYGENLHTLPLYQPDTQIIALGPVGVNLVAFPAQAPCGQPVRLAWNAINGYETLLKLNGVAVAKSGTNGEQMLNLKQTTTYFLETFGPGGVTMTPLTIQVDRAVKTSLTATPAVVRYHKVGDNILDPGSTTLDWSASNATSVRLDPIGPVTGTSGEESVTLSPKTDGYGHVEETRVFKITATNDCGGSDTTTATVEVAGSIDPPVPPAAEPLPPVLPQTGSPLPLIGLLGLGSLTCSLLLRKRRG